MGEIINCTKWEKAMVVTEEERRDYISDLPNHVLTSILSRLTIKQAARTCIVSRRWRYLWNSIPNLKLGDDFEGKRFSEKIGSWDDLEIGKWVSIMSRILVSRRDAIQSCEISSKFLQGCSSIVDQFIFLLAKRGIQELSLKNLGKDIYRVSNLVFSCKYLKALTLCNCKIELTSAFGSLSHLKTLILIHVNLTDDVLECLMSSCKKLEWLEIYCGCGLKDLKIHASDLTHLDVCLDNPISIYSNNVSHLVDVLFSFTPSSGTELVYFLRSLVDVERLHLGPFISKSLSRRNVTENSLNTYLKLKELSLSLNLLNIREVDLLARLLRSSPYLQDMSLSYGTMERGTIAGYDYWEKQKAFDCLTHHLRTVRIFFYYPMAENEIDFLKYLVINACVLQKITLKCEGPRREELEETSIEEELISLKLMLEEQASVRASSHVHLRFTPLKISI